MKTFAFVTIALTLAACAGTDGSSGGQDLNRHVLTGHTTQTVGSSPDGLLEVSVSDDGSFAFVSIGQTNVNIAQIESVASSVTGCDAKAGSFLYDKMRGNRQMVISREIIKSQFGMLTVFLTC